MNHIKMSDVDVLDLEGFPDFDYVHWDIIMVDVVDACRCRSLCPEAVMFRPFLHVMCAVRYICWDDEVDRICPVCGECYESILICYKECEDDRSVFGTVGFTVPAA